MGSRWYTYPFSRLAFNRRHISTCNSEVLLLLLLTLLTHWLPYLFLARSCGRTFAVKCIDKVQYQVQSSVYQFLAALYQFSPENHIHASYGRF